jgi:DNA-binding response OmpR family regulator
MKSGFLAIGKRGPHRFVLVVTSINAPIKASIAVERNPHGFDIVVTDRVMPQLTGLGLLRHSRPLRPDLPVVDLGHRQSRSDRTPMSFPA